MVTKIEESLQRYFRKKNNHNSPVSENCTELAALALEGKIKQVIGRNGKVARVIMILFGKLKNDGIVKIDFKNDFVFLYELKQ